MSQLQMLYNSNFLFRKLIKQKSQEWLTGHLAALAIPIVIKRWSYGNFSILVGFATSCSSNSMQLKVIASERPQCIAILPSRPHSHISPSTHCYFLAMPFFVLKAFLLSRLTIVSQKASSDH